MEADENRAENLPIVDVIASGYEWTCPKCGNLCNIIAFPKGGIAICTDCGQRVELDIPEHAFD